MIIFGLFMTFKLVNWKKFGKLSRKKSRLKSPKLTLLGHKWEPLPHCVEVEVEAKIQWSRDKTEHPKCQKVNGFVLAQLASFRIDFKSVTFFKQSTFISPWFSLRSKDFQIISFKITGRGRDSKLHLETWKFWNKLGM